MATTLLGEACSAMLARSYFVRLWATIGTIATTTSMENQEIIGRVIAVGEMKSWSSGEAEALAVRHQALVYAAVPSGGEAWRR